MASASNAISVCSVSCIDQPTILRVCRSNTGGEVKPALDEPQRRLSGQRTNGELLSQPEDRAVHHRIYDTRGEARDLFQYIEGFYNSRRLHSALGYISPSFAEHMAAYPRPLFRAKISVLRTQSLRHLLTARDSTQNHSIRSLRSSGDRRRSLKAKRRPRRKTEIGCSASANMAASSAAFGGRN
jgi:hypothetical protein